MTRVEKALRVLLLDCLALRKGELVLILADPPTQNIGQLLWESALKVTPRALLLHLDPYRRQGPSPAGLMDFLPHFQAIVSLLPPGVLGRNVLQKSLEKGARVAFLPGLTRDILERTFVINLQKVSNRTQKIADVLTIGREAELSSPAGTAFRFSLARKKGVAETGFIRNKGEVASLPGGQAYIQPARGSCQGVVVINGSMEGIGLIKHPIRFHIRNDHLTKISGGWEAEKLRSLIKPYGRDFRYLVRVGIGVHPRAQLCGNLLEDTKAEGILHIGIGYVPKSSDKLPLSLHLCGTLLKPTLLIDGRPILKAGKICI